MSSRKLKKNALGATGLLAQAIALISPTMTAALIVPTMFGTTGNWSWLSYALGTVMLLFVVFNLNVFSSRTTGTGSMYAYICRGLGMVTGGVGGWALIWAYLGISIAGATGFTVFAETLLGMVGIAVPPVLLFAVCVSISCYLAWKNVQLSAKTMLILEGMSVLLITILCLIALGSKGFAIDPMQFNPKTIPYSSIGLGVVIAVFSLVGFEAATAFGDEARDPLKAIPRSVIQSLVFSGLFFVFVTYVEVLMTHGSKTTLDQMTAPLNVIAGLVGMPILAAPLSMAAMLSFFALNLSCINAGGRIIYIMGKQGLFHSVTADAHHKNETPHAGVLIMAAMSFSLPSCFSLFGKMATQDMFNDAGTMAAFGFIVAYALVTIAAPVWLKRLGEAKLMHYLMATAAILLLIIPAVGSVYPVPAAPVNYFPYAFLVYMAGGAAWIVSQHRTKSSDELVLEMAQ